MLRLLLLSVLAALSNGEPRVVNFYEFGETISINCTTRNLDPNNETYVKHWIVPDYTDEEDGYTTLLANQTYELASTYMESEGWTLHVGWIRHTELGRYTCVWQEVGEERENEIDLNFIPPSQWSIYKNSVTVSLIVTAGFIAILVVIFLVCKFRWKDPKEDTDHRIRFTSNGVEQRPDSAFENQAFNRAEPVHVIHRSSAAVSESKM